MRYRYWSIAAVLFMATVAIYWPVRRFDLVYFDDPIFLLDSPEVKAGLTWESVKWAMSEVVIANWLPVNHLSFLVVSEFFGTNPGPHHLFNAIIHAANASLLFLLLFRLTRCCWRSALVAALFAWHPLRVESVAWISERKDVLCGFFFLASLLMYVVWVQALPSQNVRIKRMYFGVCLLLYALALLSKSMAVTLPFVLLLLDFWPLQRFQFPTFNYQLLKRLILEKRLFFLLTLAFCVATYWTQQHYAAAVSWERLGLWPRLANAISGYVIYIGQFFLPLNLVVIYPYPYRFDVLEILLKAALLIMITLGCMQQLRRRPQLTFGWLWYLGTALPIIGIIQVGQQAHADRYTYLPMIGVTVALIWPLWDYWANKPKIKLFGNAAAIVVLMTFVYLTEQQLSFWRNTITLFSQNVVVTPENGASYFSLGLGYEHAGDTNRAIVCYRVAKELLPANPQSANSLAILLYKAGNLAAAENEYTELVARFPEDVRWRVALAGIMSQSGRESEAMGQLSEAVYINPNSVEALNNLAWELATSANPELRNGSRAVQLASRACELTQYEETIYVGTLAAAYAEDGRFDEAVATAQKACDLASKNNEADLLANNRQLLERYRRHQTAR
jgi:Flp pilus assembly protein TadD